MLIMSHLGICPLSRSSMINTNTFGFPLKSSDRRGYQVVATPLRHQEHKLPVICCNKNLEIQFRIPEEIL